MSLSVSTTTMDRNPRFARLYQEMVKSRLNPDNSTKLLKQQRAAVEVEKSLHENRLDLARRSLIEEALKDVIISANLPEELTQSCRVVLAMLQGEISTAEAEILKEDLERFHEQSHQISTAISAKLQQSASLIAHMTPSSEAISASQLPAQIAALLNSTTSTAAAITTTRSRITDLTDQIGAVHREVLELAIRILEQTIHGSVSRGMKAKAEHLAVVAKGLDLKIKILAKSDALLNDPKLLSALQKYNDHLAKSIEELTTEAKVAEEEVEEYTNAGHGMEQVAEKYAELLKKKSDLEVEISRLKG